ncbi:MAG: CPBP family intramembrane metalloprotease [Deltaproteobacteria bacterium]|nr:MAG: CPBP family intramembrane metalloprotease [Deltaproteobacteria bacterium]
MVSKAVRSLRTLWEEVKAEKRLVLLLVSSAVLLTLAWYPGYYTTFLKLGLAKGNPHQLWWAHFYQFVVDLLLLVGVPVLLIKLVLKEQLRDYGVCLGDWRFAIKYLAVVFVVMAPFLYIGGKDAALFNEYPLVRGLFGQDGWTSMVLWELTYLLYYIAWEFHFRGVQQLGLEVRLGPVVAMLFQMMASTLIHVRKPFGETFSAIIGAFLIGIVVWRSRSILWGILLHWYIGASTDFWCYVHGKAAGLFSS